MLKVQLIFIHTKAVIILHFQLAPEKNPIKNSLLSISISIYCHRFCASFMNFFPPAFARVLSLAKDAESKDGRKIRVSVNRKKESNYFEIK
jgi:hypothetical protein